MMKKVFKVGILGASVFYFKNIPRNRIQQFPDRSPFRIHAEELKQPTDLKSKECILGK